MALIAFIRDEDSSRSHYCMLLSLLEYAVSKYSLCIGIKEEDDLEFLLFRRGIRSVETGTTFLKT